MELRCSRSLALALGAIEPDSLQQHRALNQGRGHLLIRETDTSQRMFWRWQPELASMIIEARSS